MSQANSNSLRRWRRRLQALRNSPLHPQWLLSSGVTEERLSTMRGLVVDIGCASQRLRPLLHESVRYLALDYPATGAADYAARPEIWADAQRLPLASGSCDAVLLVHVLEHVAEPSRALEEAIRILKPGGILCAETPLFYPLHDLPNDYLRPTPPALRNWLDGAGLQIEHLETDNSAVATAALLGNLALSQQIAQWLDRPSPASLLLPFAVALIPIINLLGKLLSFAAHGNDFLPHRVTVVALKPEASP